MCKEVQETILCVRDVRLAKECHWPCFKVTIYYIAVDTLVLYMQGEQLQVLVSGREWDFCQCYIQRHFPTL